MRTVFCTLALAGTILAGPAVAAATDATEGAQVECLALAIYWEARSRPPRDRRAIAHVALNRLEHPEFPDTVCGVVKQGGEQRDRCQFSWWCDGKSDWPVERDAWRQALDLAEATLQGETSDPTRGALFFHHSNVEPKWATKKQRVVQIGPHLFYR